MSDPAGERQSAGPGRRQQRARSAPRTAPRQGNASSQGKGASRGKSPSQGKAPSKGKAQRNASSPADGRASGRASRDPAGRVDAPRAGTPSSVLRGDAVLSAHRLVDAQNEDRRRANALRLRVLAAAAGVLPAVVVGVVIGVGIGIVAGAVVALAVFVAVAVGILSASLEVALRLVGGAPVSSGALPALENQVEGLCSTLGVARPRLWLVDDPVANACALTGRRGRSVLVVTSGLLSRLGLIEMEGVVAHELVHVKRRDAAVSSVAVATAGLVAWVSGRDELVHLAVGRGREYETDQAAALAVRYPPGLHDALASMGGQVSGGASSFSGRRWAATRWIWIDPMVGEPERPRAGELDATKTRVDALAQW